MSIKQWPINERPREKLIQQGAEMLSDAELLSILFRTGIRGYSAMDIAREALNLFGGLKPLLQADADAFQQTFGLGITKYVQLQAALELAWRYLDADAKQADNFNNSISTRHFIRARLQDEKEEVFSCLFLNKRHELLAFKKLFRGTIDSAAVYPRVLVKYALQYNAAAIILAHNHPSGHAQPSEQDHLITQNIQKIMQLIDIEVLDHIVVGSHEAISMAEKGWL